MIGLPTIVSSRTSSTGTPAASAAARRAGRACGSRTTTASPPEGDGSSETEPPSAADQLTATLESLAALRDRGLITVEEYEAKKRDLLERM